MLSFLKFTSRIRHTFPKPFIGSYLRGFGTASPNITQTPQQAKEDPSTISKETKKSLEIKGSWDNARIIDYRDHFNPLNKVAVFCPHASNILPEPYKWSEHDKYFVDKHWARDLGALNMAVALAQGLQCVLCHALHSRLLIDTNRGVYEDELFRKQGDGVKVELNQNLSDEEKTSRITKYHSSYYNAGREVLQIVDPDIIFSVHSFTPIYEGKSRDIEVGFVYVASEELSKKLHDNFKPRGYKTGLNQPYTGNLGYSLNVVLREQVPRKVEGVCFEIRNDLLLDMQRFKKLKEDLLDVIRLTCFSEDTKQV